MKHTTTQISDNIHQLPLPMQSPVATFINITLATQNARYGLKFVTLLVHTLIHNIFTYLENGMSSKASFIADYNYS